MKTIEEIAHSIAVSIPDMVKEDPRVVEEIILATMSTAWVRPRETTEESALRYARNICARAVIDRRHIENYDPPKDIMGCLGLIDLFLMEAPLSRAENVTIKNNRVTQAI